eukprot:216263-Rhodomonas_salina.1
MVSSRCPVLVCRGTAWHRARTCTTEMSSYVQARHMCAEKNSCATAAHATRTHANTTRYAEALACPYCL